MRPPPFAFWKPGAPPVPPGIDPATRNCRVYADGSLYVPATGNWPGTASAGNSGNVLRTGAQPIGAQRPTAGPALNGIQTVHLDNAASQFVEIPNGGGVINPPIPAKTEVPPRDWTYFAVFKWDPTGAPNNALAAAYNNEALCSDFGTNRINVAMRPAAMQILVDPGGGRVGVEVTTNFVPGTWQIVTARGNGGDLQARMGLDTFVALGSIGRIDAVPSSLSLGRSSNPPGAHWLGDLAVEIMIDGYEDDPTCDGIVTFLKNRWGL